MGQIKSPAKPVMIDFECDVCKVGRYRPTGIQLTSYPPQYPHICNNEECQDKKTFNMTYPKITYEA